LSEASIPQLNYGEIGRALLDRGARERLPLAGAIELTQRCNLACVHCYVNLSPGDKAAKARELTTAEICGIYDQLAAAGTIWLTVTGGEPLLRPDFAELYKHAWRLGLMQTVYTNATMITPEVIELFETHPPFLVEITQYGLTPDVYDEVTDIPGAYRRFDRGIELLRKTRIEWSLKAMALKENGHEILAIKQRAADLGVKFRYDTMINPRIDGGRGPLQHRLTPAQVAAFDVDDKKRHAEWRDYCEPRWGKSSSDAKYQCGAGHSTFLIDPYGKLHMCELSRRPGYDLRTGSFVEGWYGALPTIRAEKRDTTQGCGTCSAVSLCTQCPGNAELEGISMTEGNPYLCEVTEHRARGIDAPAHVQPQGLIQLRRSKSVPSSVPSPAPVPEGA
jgi:radical SAM protein with 4Fe4S-binding SPASM domain